MYWVYIVECADGTLYTGWTNDIKKRIVNHNKGIGAKYTRTRYPVALKYSEECATKNEAMRREWYIKQMTRRGKLDLIVLQEKRAKSKHEKMGEYLLSMKQSFGPVVNSKSRVLLLGSMPGEESLRKQQYYAYAKNQFWPIIYAIFGLKIEGTYQQRIEFLLNSGIALWDVIEKCEREGSLDAKIKNEVPNDINGLLEAYPDIRFVGFNGTKAYETFKVSVKLLWEKSINKK